MHQILIKTIKSLVDKGSESKSENWQSIKIDNKNPIIEIDNVFFTIDTVIDPLHDFEPDLPWAEDHFLERVNGKPINPGEQYKNWPYYKGLDNDNLFRSSGIFSHNYMERYWCKGYKGIRYDYGDLNDIIERLKNDPHTRQAFLSVWHPEDQSNSNVRVPCTIGYWFKIENNKLNVSYLIRSCDAVRHFKNDLYMTYRLMEFISNELGLKPGSISTWIGSFHCFKSDLYTLKKIK